MYLRHPVCNCAQVLSQFAKILRKKIQPYLYVTYTLKMIKWDTYCNRTGFVMMIPTGFLTDPSNIFCSQFPLNSLFFETPCIWSEGKIWVLPVTRKMWPNVILLSLLAIGFQSSLTVGTVWLPEESDSNQFQFEIVQELHHDTRCQAWA